MTNARKSKTSSRPGVRRLKGRGDFTDAVDTLPKQLNRIEKKLEGALAPKPMGSLGSGLGRLAGSFLGQGDLGSQAGDALQKWMGFGDYELSTNSLIKGEHPSKSSSIPTFQKDGKRGIRLTEREYIGDIFSGPVSGVFQNRTFRINPADSSTFPWLSTIANQFDEWEPLGIIFEYVPTSAEWNGTTQSLGTVITATDYDPTDPAYNNKLVMESADYARSARPSCGIQHGIECDMSERGVRTFYTASSAPSTDIRLTDLGNFQIATFGINGTNVNLGELWVTYDIAFYKKQLTGGQVGSQCSDFLSVTSLPTNADPVGSTASDFRRLGNLPITVSRVGAATRLTFPPNIQTGFYELTIAAGAATSVTLLGATVVADPLGSTVLVSSIAGGGPGPLNTSNGATVMSRTCVQVLNTAAYVTIPDTAIQYTGTPGFIQVRVFQVAPLPFTNL